MDLQLVCSGSIVYLRWEESVRYVVGEKQPCSVWGNMIYRSYISYIDRSVVCVYPLLRSHVVKRCCGENKNCFCPCDVKDLHRCSPQVKRTLITSTNIFLASSLTIHLSECGSPQTTSLFWGGAMRGRRRGRKRWGDAQRQKKSPQAAARTLLVL